MKNECSTRATSWGPPDVFKLYRKRRKVAELVKDQGALAWRLGWCRDNAKDWDLAVRWMLILNMVENPGDELPEQQNASNPASPKTSGA